MSSLDTRLDGLLEQRKQKGRYRTLREYDTQNGGLIDFVSRNTERAGAHPKSSNDYLSVTASPKARELYLHRLASSHSIFGSTGSRLLSGCSTSHSSLEHRFATFFHSPAALLFNSGWDANVSFFATVPQPKDWIIYDELVHASVHSGMRASRVTKDRRIAFKHNDPEALRRVLKEITLAESSTDQPVIFIAMESLYSMDGDMAPLPAILAVIDELVPRSRQCVVLDEAHSTGVYGDQGRGVGYVLGEEGSWGDQGHDRGQGRVDVRLMTFGKAVGCSGAVLLCTPTIRSFLINYARPFIFSTAIPHSTLIALDSVWDVLQSDEGQVRRQKLYAIASHLQSILEPLLDSVPPSMLRLPTKYRNPFAGSSALPADPPSPILGLITPEPHALAKLFLDRGFIVRPVVPPTVPLGEERVRICLRADMSLDLMDRLVAVLREWVRLKRTETDSTSSQSITSTKAKL